MNDQGATTHDGHGLDASEQRTGRRTVADACSLRHTQEGSRAEVLPDALGRSSKQREPPRNPAQKAMEQETEREASGISSAALRPLHARSLLLPRPPPFIGHEGAVRH